MSLDVYVACPTCGDVADFNATHNLRNMAKEAGVYLCLWRPDEVGVKYASDLIGPLKAAVKDMTARPDHYRQFNPPNGWGTYDGFLIMLQELLETCEMVPTATIRVSA